MSGEELSEHDRMVLGYDQDAQRNGQADSTDGEYVTREEFEAFQSEVLSAVSDLQEEVESLGESDRNIVQQLNQIKQELDGDVSTAGTTTLEKYASMPEDVREDTLGSSDRRAVVIYNHWDKLAERTQAGYCLTTQRRSAVKNNPSTVKLQLEKITGEDLAWTEIYRAMMAVAKLSGGEPERDQYGRKHIQGGDFEYHEKSTPDGADTYKVLVKEDHR